MRNLQATKALVALTLAAGATGASAAVALGENGLGQGLLFPYYTVEGGQATTIAVQNTTSSAKALKVRVIESYAGRDALLFNVYLAPYATWTSALISRPDGQGGMLQFTPGTCSTPLGTTTPEGLRNFAYTGSRQDGGVSDHTRTRQGQIEVIEMGTLDGSLVPLVSKPTDGNCQTLLTRWTDGGVWQAVDANANLLPPSGGLRGDAIVINVEGGTAFGYQALGFTGLAAAARHTRPDSSRPRLYDITTPAGEDIAVTVVDADGNAESLAYAAGRGMDAISALLTVSSVSSSYNVSPSLGARTDWILSFPLRYAYVDDAPGGTLPAGTFPIAPFTSRTCEEGSLVRYGGSGGKLPEPENGVIDLCTQSKTLRFRHSRNDVPLVGGADAQLIPADESGTAVLDVGTVDGDARLLRPDASGRCVRGLPIWLLSVTAYDNSNAQPGRVATYPDARVGTGKRVIEDC